ncbi:MAG: chaperone modulator CbpM [Bacteroidota bacterium]
MEPQLITITQYCVNYDIETQFIEALEESGIIELTIVDAERYIHEQQFGDLERYIHFHYDLHINIEGIDAIRHLLGKIDAMHQEINQLKSKLYLHE